MGEWNPDYYGNPKQTDEHLFTLYNKLAALSLASAWRGREEIENNFKPSQDLNLNKRHTKTITRPLWSLPKIDNKIYLVLIEILSYQ